MTFAKHVHIVEVGPRDGLQNEAARVDAATRIELVERLISAGLVSIEVGSFVSPKWVPQMADSAEVLAVFAARTDVSFPVLVPNEKGLAAALAAGAREIAVFAAASEAFSRKNINCSIEESLARFAPVMATARAAGVRVRGYVSCVLGCPYQGEVPLADVVWVARALVDMGCYEVSLGDTIGVGTPLAAARMVGAVAAAIPVERIAIHFHDTYGQALANTLACLDLGVSVIDASVGGLGGCPYAAGASGNLATEDLVYMLNGLGIETGIDLDRLIDAAHFISSALGRPVGSRVGRALGGRSARKG